MTTATSANGHVNGKAAILGNRDRKPALRPVDPNAIHDGLKSFDRWLGWRWVWNTKANGGRGGYTKVPVDARSGGTGSSTDPHTWCSFNQAMAGVRAGRCDGIGFALGEDDCGICFAGIDLDDCRDPATGELSQLALDTIAALDSYTEVSPSDTGIKIVCIGKLADGSRTKNKAGTFEVYCRGRFFTITGQHVDGTPKRVEPRQEQLTAAWEKCIGSEQQTKPRSVAANLPPQNGDTSAALYSMLRILPKDTESDGSNRLLAVCCRAVEHNLDDTAAVETIRQYAERRPFPADWTDDDIVRRLRDAERKATRGEALRSTPRHLTDLGNAERFAEQHGEDVRYCHEQRSWYVFDGRRWLIDTSGEVIRKAKRTIRSIYVEASSATDSDRAKALASFGVASERRERISAAIALAESEQPIPISVSSLDAEPKLLNFPNGTVELKDGDLREHRREDYITKCCPVEYPTEAGDDPELWLSTLDRIFEGKTSQIKYLQRLFGVSLVGEVIEHILPIFYGAGANGKTVVLETWCGMLGDYAGRAPHSLLMTTKSDRHPCEIADMHGKRLIAGEETAEGGRLSESLVKELTGGSTISARRMRENFWTFKPSHTLVLATNHRPTIRGCDHGIWRRIHLVPFTVTIPADEQDKHLAEKLKAEWPAILRWAVAGCIEWQRNGLNPPPEVIAATETYRVESDTFKQWFDECCEADDSSEWKASLAYRSYRAWCEAANERPATTNKFAEQVSLHLFTRSTRRRDGYYYLGFKALAQ